MANSQGSPAGDPTRALAAIMFSDVADYTLIMGRDEQKGVRAVTEHRRILQSQVPKFGGRIIVDAGDGTLSSFPSAVQAVHCARQIQQSLSDNSEFSIRIGIHVGDVVFADGNVLGDGVNIASRIHSLAPRGGICISARVYDEIRNQPDIAVRDLGEQGLKHVARPVHVYLLTVARQGLASRIRSNRLLMPVRRHIAAIGIGLVIALSLGYAFFTDIATAALVYVPRLFPHLEQKISYSTTSDGVRIAYATMGTGPPVVLVLGFLTDVKYGTNSPTYNGEFLKLVSQHHLTVQYDGRGFGMSDRGIPDFSNQARVRDLEAVVDALELKKFALYAISGGATPAITYAARHPDRVTRLLLQDVYAKWDWSLIPAGDRERQVGFWGLVAHGWDVHAVREMFASISMPEASPIVRAFFEKMASQSGSPEDTLHFLLACGQVDVTAEAKEIRAPTLILHVRGDQMMPLVFGQQLAQLIPGSRLVIVEGHDHIPIPGDGQAEQITRVIGPFLDQDLTERAGTSQP
jgi:class 3 adenylate cyclase/pimeloyl-ACP methyl ester carboxylesterase